MSYIQGRKFLTTIRALRSEWNCCRSSYGEHVKDYTNSVFHDGHSYRSKWTFSKFAGNWVKILSLPIADLGASADKFPLQLSVRSYTVLRKDLRAKMKCAPGSPCLRSVVPSRVADFQAATGALGCERGWASDLCRASSGINYVREAFSRNYGSSGAVEAVVTMRVAMSRLKCSAPFVSGRCSAQTGGFFFGSISHNRCQPFTALECETEVGSRKSSDGGAPILDTMSKLRAAAGDANHHENTEAIPIEAAGPATIAVPNGGSSENLDDSQIEALRSRKLGLNSPYFSARSSSRKSRRIHGTAAVDPCAVLGEGVEIGPFCTVGPKVKLGDGCKLHPNAHVFGETELGEKCELLTGAIVGADMPGCTIIGDRNVFGHYSVVGIACQDMKYKEGDPCFLDMGNNNDIREFVSIHRSSKPTDKTILGNNNLVMGSCHVAHDCKIGNRNIFANNTLLGGHVVVEDLIHTGGGVAVHQFCHLSSYSFLAGGSMVDRDVPMFMMVSGDRAELRGLNLEGMRRCGFSDIEVRSIRKAYQKLFMSSDSNAGGIEERLSELDQNLELSNVPVVRMMLKSVRDSFGEKRRGICRFRHWSSV